MAGKIRSNRGIAKEPRSKDSYAINAKTSRAVLKLAKEFNVGRSAIADYILTTHVNQFDKQDFMEYFFKGE